MKTNEQLMKACQIGCNNLNDANNLLAECYGRIGRLTEENERLRKEAEVGYAIERAAAELPAGYIVGISIESGAATVDLGLPTGHIKNMDVDGDNRLAAEVDAAIDAARGGKCSE